MRRRISPRAHAHAARRIDDVGRHLADAGRDVADQDHQRERDHADDRVRPAEPDDRDQQREKRERRNRVEESADARCDQRKTRSLRAATMPTASEIAKAMASAVSGDRRRARRSATSDLVPVAQEPFIVASVASVRDTQPRGDAARRSRLDIRAERTVVVEHRRRARARASYAARAPAPSASRRRARADRSPAPRSAARSRRDSAARSTHRGGFATQCERHRRVILDAFRDRQEVERRRDWRDGGSRCTAPSASSASWRIRIARDRGASAAAAIPRAPAT